MYRMDKITTGISYGASGGSAIYWFRRLLDGYSPEQWAAMRLFLREKIYVSLHNSPASGGQ